MKIINALGKIALVCGAFTILGAIGGLENCGTTIQQMIDTILIGTMIGLFGFITIAAVTLKEQKK